MFYLRERGAILGRDRSHRTPPSCFSRTADEEGRPGLHPSDTSPLTSLKRFKHTRQRMRRPGSTTMQRRVCMRMYQEPRTQGTLATCGNISTCEPFASWFILHQDSRHMSHSHDTKAPQIYLPRQPQTPFNFKFQHVLSTSRLSTNTCCRISSSQPPPNHLPSSPRHSFPSHPKSIAYIYTRTRLLIRHLLQL